ncbi:hypothetical protein CTI12_AA393650 [Artemisia annua]|uniref:Uncharacterized protein n=1 Tax=Artemisia annua TaxID=35608 RepID=A0A2U1LKL0_ARTAN|nr:hypothetical protein CTI12_AA393650 [Artemisia annua]
MSTPPPGFEMNADSGGVRTRSGGRRDARGCGVIFRGSGVMMKGGASSPKLFRQGGRFVHAGRFSEPGNSREGDGLTRVNGKLVRTRGRGDGSRARMYPQGIKPIGYGVSYDPIDGEPMLGDVIGIPRPAWPPDDAQVQAEIALTQSQPMPSQENPVQAANEIVQDDDLHEEEPSPLRRSERIKQIIFNKPPAPGPGLSEDDAIEV